MENRCHFDWGPVGAVRAAERGDIVIVVDTLSFSTCIATGIEKNGSICPCSDPDRLMSMAAELAAEWSVSRTDVPENGRFSLSPLTFKNLEQGNRVVLLSPNGAHCSERAVIAPFVFTGALVNAQQLATAVGEIIIKKKLSVTVIACGERVKTDIADNFRWAIEDYLGAGAIISYLRCKKSNEAQLCESVFIRNLERLNVILLECESGQELCNLGFRDDVLYSAQLNICKSVPILDNLCYVNIFQKLL